MEKNENQQNREEIFLRKYFIVSAGVLVVFILLGITDVNIIIERAITIFGFWIMLFLSIFLPRRMLKKSRKFRYLMLYIRKHYPIILYYRERLNIIKYINFFFEYTRFYLERGLKYVLVGTKIRWLRPYRKNWEKGEYISIIIIELYRWVHYLVLYILKIFYEVVKFFDNATLIKIIKSRIFGFMIVTIGYIIIGVNFFICYVVSLLIMVGIYYTLNIYVTYKEWMEKYPSAGKLKNLSDVLLLRGFTNKLEFFSKLEIKEIRNRTLLYIIVMKIKGVLYLKSIARKYGVVYATKLWINVINGLASIDEKTKIADVFLTKKEKEEAKMIEISKYEFTARFWKKREWYENDSVMQLDAKMVDNFTNVMEVYSKNFCNLLDFKLYFIYVMMGCFDVKNVWDDSENRIVKDFWNQSNDIQNFYLKILSNYFEFKDIYIFVKEIEKKIKEEGDSIKFFDKYIIKTTAWEQMKNLTNLKHHEIITKKEFELLKLMLLYSLMGELGFVVNNKEFEEILHKGDFVEEVISLEKKGLWFYKALREKKD